jgi:hypothetical protein
MHADLELPIELDIENAVCTPKAKAVFASLEAEGDVTLPPLAGGDLCMLGGLRWPFFWEPLAARWRSLPQAVRNEYMEARAGRMTEQGHLVELVSGGSCRPAARYGVGPEISILLAACSRPAYVVTTHFSSRAAPLSLFALGGDVGPVRGIVMAYLVRTGRPRPVADIFAHVLATEVRSAELLAEWVIRAAPKPSRFRGQPPRLVSLFHPGSGGVPMVELSVLGNGTTAQVAGPGVAGELDMAALRTVLLDLFGEGARKA